MFLASWISHMKCAFVASGCEGAAQDVRVSDAICTSRTDFRFLLVHYSILADGDYALRRGCLTPYRGVRYPFARCLLQVVCWDLQMLRELFQKLFVTQRLRNCVERRLGVRFKRRLRIWNYTCLHTLIQSTSHVLLLLQLHRFVMSYELEKGGQTGGGGLRRKNEAIKTEKSWLWTKRMFVVAQWGRDSHCAKMDVTR